MAEENMEYDIVIVGAGPAGLTSAIRYAQLCKKENKYVKVAVLEKGAEVGAHILSGAVFEPRVLNALLPNWQTEGAPVKVTVEQDAFYYLTRKRAWPLPLPKMMKNTGNYIISLGRLCHWLAKQAETLGVDIFCGFAGQSLLTNDQGTVIGVETDAKGLDPNGHPKQQYQPGVKIYAKQVVLAEGCRGSLSQHVIKKFELDQSGCPQTYGLGLKEIWEVPKAQHQPGTVIHTVGWPLSHDVYGGSFIYHWGENLVSLGLVVGLDYKNPYLRPFEELQRLKHHPKIAKMLSNGRCVSYGARALNEGGWQSIPKLTFPGGMLIGCSAGFLNVAKIKGSHTAMQSGLLAADALFSQIHQQPQQDTKNTYQQKLNESWVSTELYRVRNIRPAFKWGLLPGLAYAGLDMLLFRGKAPWTFKTTQADHLATQLAKDSKPISYPKPDGVLSFDRLTCVRLTNVKHREDEPCHLKMQDPTLAITVNWAQYAGLEQNYCPAGVYEYIEDEKGKRQLQINAANCIHCKTCDIKDPKQNIKWVSPEGGDGPNYSNM